MALVVGNLVAKFGLDAKGFFSGMKQVAKSAKRGSENIASATQSMNLFKLAIVGVGIAAYGAVKRLANLLRKVQSLNRTMKLVSETAEQNQENWAFLRKQSKRLGIDISTLAQNFVNLRNSAKGTVLTNKELDEVFLGLSEKAAVLGLSSEKVASMFAAVSQMASNNVITMTRLRLQLGTAMPGALTSMATALGVTTQELTKMVSSGKLLAQDVLPLFGKQLRKEAAEGVKTLGVGLRSALSRLSTAWADLQDVMATGIVADTLSLTIDVMGAGVTMLQAMTKAVQSLWDTTKEWAAWWVKWLDVNEDTMSGLGLNPVKMNKVIEDVKEATEELEETAGKTAEDIQKIFDDSAYTLEEWQKDVTATFEDVLGEFTSFLSDLATGADVTFGDMLKNMAKKMLDFATEMLIIKPMLMWFSTWMKDMGGEGGGIAASILGMLGKPTAMADGGIISEPVLGIGARSKSSYLIGEAGPEAVVPLGGGGSGGGVNNVNVTINALDSKSVADLMRDNPQAITGPLVEAIKGGDRGLASSLRMAVN